MRKEKGLYVWVHPDFKRALKHKAADENKSIISLTKDMADNFEDRDRKKKKINIDFNPGF